MSDSKPLASLAAITARAREALRHWGLQAQTPTLLKYRENAVFQIQLANGQPAALRLHRSGYHDEKALASELVWMATLGKANIAVPAPIPTEEGHHIVSLAATVDFDAQHADIVSWMAGRPLGQSGVPLAHAGEGLVAIFRSLGETMARMHLISDGWTPPSSFHRPAWDKQGLLGDQPLWGRFWDCPGLSADQRQRLTTVRQQLQKQMDALPNPGLDYGLIHADLVRENVLVNDGCIELIDFDDGGYGFRMFDIATALFKNRAEPAYPAIKAALIDGYRQVRSLPDSALATLPLFMVLRSVTYIGWAGDRLDMPDADARLQRYVADTLALADDIGMTAP
jgi:Ser/Thr protein kinase RdoA (MazF antagonist)